MNTFIHGLHKRASDTKSTIILPETSDIRVLKAAEYLQQNNICEVHLVGSRDEIFEICSTEKISIDRSTPIYNPRSTDDENFKKMVDRLVVRRGAKGMTREKATMLCQEPLWFAAGLVALGKVDAGLAGSVHTTGDVLRAGLFMIGTSPNVSVISGAFLMSWDDGTVFAFADCAVIPYPDPQTLADIAINTAEMYSKMTSEVAKVAFLSFATLDSAQHEKVDLVREAVKLFHDKRPDLIADGPLQFDAAYLQEVGKRKAPHSSVAGRANVFIFPNLDAGNIAYKITERLAGAKATGPIITGFDRPFNDLSRGASVADIVDTACVAILMK